MTNAEGSAPSLGRATREVLLSLAGLWLGDERIEQAVALLSQCAEHAHGGALSARWPLQNGAPADDAIAALYFVENVRLLIGYARSQRVVDTVIYDAVLDVVQSIARGNAEASLDDDGLLVTSVHNGRKTIEAQALWHNALRTAADLAQARNAALLSAELKVLAKRSRDATERHFWRENEGFFVNSLDDQFITPESLLTISLGYPMIDRTRATRLVAAAKSHLLTDHGLRTLPKQHPAYDGGRVSRFTSTGAVMPLWLGVYARALTFAVGSADAARSEIEQVISPLLDRYSQEDLVLDMPEAFTDDDKHTPLGQLAYPPSRAELLRAHDECLLGRGPSPEHIEQAPSLVPLAMKWEVEI